MIATRFRAWLEAGGNRVGEVAIRRVGPAFTLTHWAEADDASGLERFTEPEAARRIALYTDTEAYRPLKTAPNLRHGWRLDLPDDAALLLALDLFYPAVLGLFAAFEGGRLEIVPLRETLGRQSGMYAATRKLTDEEARQTLRACCGGCQKKILWPLEPGVPVAEPEAAGGCGGFPLLCNEACNWLVAAARKTVKERA